MITNLSDDRCSVDNPGHTYTYSWEGNPSWSRAYVGAEEVFEYYKGRAKAYGVYEYVNFNHRVIEARWDDYVGQWKLKIEKDGSSIIEDECEVLINVCGMLKYVINPDLAMLWQLTWIIPQPMEVA